THAHELLPLVHGHNLLWACTPDLLQSLRLAVVEAGQRRAGVREQAVAVDLQRDHVVGEEVGPQAAELQDDRGLARTRWPEQGDSASVQRRCARVEDLKPL